ncbi:hypothetical protein EUGRSUZ_B00362 [Eucalyptus grandis]|uniref:Uncharacterized protein n=2 Tax=Eucalyptus grandis TaxID=71139 RepID=A0ACC3LME3_EUCGR|nr:hypothetical protein EUGRSUZ_B00362 [Eucalyptus grandis]
MVDIGTARRLTFITISKKKKAARFKPNPYVAMVLNCAIWVYYGMSHVRPRSPLVVIINAFSLGIELIYWTILLVLLVELIFMAALVALCRSSALLVMLCIIFNIVMYTSPLTIMTKSVKYMPFYMSLAMFLNGITWAVYALLKFKPFVLYNVRGSLQLDVQLIPLRRIPQQRRNFAPFYFIFPLL